MRPGGPCAGHDDCPAYQACLPVLDPTTGARPLRCTDGRRCSFTVDCLLTHRTKLCHPELGVCVECRTDDECPEARSRCEPETHRCVEAPGCRHDAECCPDDVPCLLVCRAGECGETPQGLCYRDHDCAGERYCFLEPELRLGFGACRDRCDRGGTCPRCFSCSDAGRCVPEWRCKPGPRAPELPPPPPPPEPYGRRSPS